MTEMGQELFELTYTSTELAFNTNLLPGNLKPEYIVMDVMISFADPDTLTHILATAGLTLHETIKQDCTRRDIYDNDIVIIETSLKKNILKYENFLRGYSYLMYQGDSGIE